MQRFNRFLEHAGSRIEGLETDQKRLITSTKLLTYRKNRVETVLETLPEAVMILDESGAITFANQKLAAMFGVSQEVILAQAPQEWCDNPDILQLLDKHQRRRTGVDACRARMPGSGNRALQNLVGHPLRAGVHKTR